MALMATSALSAPGMGTATGVQRISISLAELLGNGFETLPPRPIPFKPFLWLKFVDLCSVGLGLASVPFHGGWSLVEWRPMSAIDWLETEFDRICEEIEEEERVLGTELKKGKRKQDQVPESGLCLDSEVEETWREESAALDGETGGGITDQGVWTEDLSTPDSGLKHPAEAGAGVIPKKRRVKMPARRTDLPWVRKALREQSIPFSHKTPSKSAAKSPTKSPSQPTRKSFRLIAQGSKSRPTKQGPLVIEDIPSSSEETPVRSTSPKSDLKRKGRAESSSTPKSPAKPLKKKVKTEMVTSPKLEKFQKRGVVRGKLVRVSYFQE